MKEWRSPYFYQIFEKSFEGVHNPIVVYDIGANVGAWGDIVLTEFPVKKLYSFEPEEENFSFLSERLNRDSCVNINKGIFYGKSESIAYGKGDNNCGGYFVGGLKPFGISGYSTGKVFELVELESLDIEKPDLIKIDIEGSELNLIEHSTILKECKKLIIEWHFNPEEARPFFEKHLKHNVTLSLEDKMFLLEL